MAIVLRDGRGRFRRKDGGVPPRQAPDVTLLTDDETAHVHRFMQCQDDLIPLGCVADRLTERGSVLGEDLAWIVTHPDLTVSVTVIDKKDRRAILWKPHVALYTHNARNLYADIHDGEWGRVTLCAPIANHHLGELCRKYYPDDFPSSKE